MYFIKLLLTQLLARKSQLIAVGKVLSVSVLNQVVSSGTNFALGIYLVRTLTPAEFGLYGIGFTISLFYMGIGNALFLTQMVVYAPDKMPDDRLPYAGRMFLLLTLFCVATVLFFVPILLMVSTVWESAARYAEFASAITAASITYLLKEFFVRHAYNVRQEAWALAIHVAIACTTVVLLWIQHQFITSFNVEMALWIYAATQISGAILGHLLVRLPVATHRWSALLSDLREAWHGGKWASMINLLFFARTQAHTIVVASLLGPVGVAKLNATRLLITPVVMLTPALSQVAMPRLAAARGQGQRWLMKLSLFFTSTLLFVSMFYCTILLVGYDLIVNKIFGANYQGLFALTVLWCLWTCLFAVRTGAEIVGQVLKKFKSLTLVNMLSAFFSLTATYILTTIYGLPGSLIGLLLGEILLITLIFRILMVSSNPSVNFPVTDSRL